MDDEMRREVLEEAPIGYAFHRIIADDAGKPVDYVFLEVNRTFERLTGLSREKIVGQRATEVLPGLREGDFDWVAYYGRIALNGNTRRFVRYSAPLERFYRVEAYAPRRGYFVTLFRDITAELDFPESTRQLMEHWKDGNPWQWIADRTARFAGATGVAVSRYDRPPDIFAVEAVAPGESAGKDQSGHLARLPGREWRLDPHISEGFRERETLSFDTLGDGGLEGFCPEGARFAVRIGTAEDLLGVLTLCLPPEETELDRPGLVELFAGQVADFLQRRRESERRREAEDLQNLLIRAFSKSINVSADTAERNIHSSLAEIGRFVGADRAYVFDYDFTAGTTSNTYEWCRERIPPQIDELQDVPMEGFPDWLESHVKGEPMIVPDVLALPRGRLREILESQGIRSLITVPMMLGEQCLGFVGFDYVRRHHRLTDRERRLLEGFAQVAVNIREKLRAEGELTLREERLSLAMDGAGFGLWDWDLESGEIYYSPNYTKMLGYDPAELPMTPEVWQKLMHPDDLATVLPRIREKARRILPFAEEFRLHCKDGSWKWISGQGRSYDRNGDGRPDRILGINVDIDRRKRDEEALRRSEEERRLLREAREAAEEASRAKSEFLANMSHEIRTPLNGVIGMLQLLEAEALNETQRENSHTAIQSARRLARLLGDILDLSQVDAGSAAPIDEPFDLDETLAALRELFRQSAAEKGIALSVERAEGMPTELCGDGTRLTQILFNLVGNGVKYTEAGRVQVGVDDLGAEEPSGTRRLLFTVRDTGCGIDEVERERVFQVFRQGERALYTRRHEGAGLGLPLVERLTALLGGTVELESAPGSGTTVRVALPFRVREHPVAPERETAESAEGELAGIRVLLVEDDRVSRLVAVSFLEKEGAAVETASNGREALEKLEGRRFDGVFMDIRMPVMDGMEAARRIRTSGKAYRGIPIVALTAHALPGDRERFLQAGMDGYVSKPAEREKLRAACLRYMDSRGSRRQ